MDAVEPFVVDIPEADLADLRERLHRTRWPEAATVEGWDQGVPLNYLRSLCAYWADEYDWRSTERRLNELPQFRTTIDEVDIHFVHVRSPHPDATPLIMTHGWPGSFLEYEQTFRLLTHPEDPRDAFHVVCPSLPGYGFSGKPTVVGWDIHRIARAWGELMTRLGYDQFVALGGDWGSGVTTSLGGQLPERLRYIHLLPPLVGADRADFDNLDEFEAAAVLEMRKRAKTGSGYSAIQGTRPQTLGYSLADSPAGQCAWILEKLWTWTHHDGDLDAVLSRDQVLDNISLYWLTNTATSSARLYWHSINEVSGWIRDQSPDPIDVPTACTVYPEEAPRPSRRWAERRFVDIRYWSVPERGGHFGAWEQPASFVDEVRAAARALRLG
jgi:pimeloyl-ACP methyl ester carboxylesterase